MTNKQINIAETELNHLVCDLCGSDQFYEIAKQDRYGIDVTASMCQNCGLVMLNPRPNDAWFANFYENDYRLIYEAQAMPDVAYISKPRRIKKHQINIETIAKFFDFNHKRVLDIGCAEGMFLNMVNSQYQATRLTGIESSKNFSEFARTYFGLKDIRTGSVFDTIEPNDKFDLIHCSHVFEHILHPSIFLKLCYEKLDEDGLIFIDVPDVATLREGNHYFHIAHVYYFSVKTLTEILAKHGFHCLYVSNQNRYHSPNKVPWTIQVIAQKHPSREKMELVDDHFPDHTRLLDWLKHQWGEKNDKI